MLMLFFPVNCETYEASVGFVGSTLIGRSQLKVSTSTCSAPVHTVTSDWFCRTTGASTGSRAVTNSKCRRHLNITGEENKIIEWDCCLIGVHLFPWLIYIFDRFKPSRSSWTGNKPISQPKATLSNFQHLMSAGFLTYICGESWCDIEGYREREMAGGCVQAGL